MGVSPVLMIFFFCEELKPEWAFAVLLVNERGLNGIIEHDGSTLRICKIVSFKSKVYNTIMQNNRVVNNGINIIMK